jgi:hypothetical protein
MPVKHTQKRRPLSPSAQLDALGIAHHADGDAITSVVLPWTYQQWVHVVARSGHWLPACCDACSFAKDRLLHALRSDGELETDDLAFVAEALAHHGGDYPAFEDPTFVPKSRRPKDPLDLLARIWHIVAPTRRPSWEEAPKPAADLDRFDSACHALGDAISGYRWAGFFFSPCDHMAPRERELAEFRVRHEKQLALARMGAPLAAVARLFPAQWEGDLEGLALVAVADPSRVCENSGGPCLFLDAAAAEEFCARLFRDPGYPREAYRIRPCRITRDQGLVFTDESDPAPPTPATPGAP